MKHLNNCTNKVGLCKKINIFEYLFLGFGIFLNLKKVKLYYKYTAVINIICFTFD